MELSDSVHTLLIFALGKEPYWLGGRMAHRAVLDIVVIKGAQSN
jgi:hypothetical protein